MRSAVDFGMDERVDPESTENLISEAHNCSFGERRNERYSDGIGVDEKFGVDHNEAHAESTDACSIAFKSRNLILLTFFINFILLILKSLMYILTKSLVVFASTLDSLLDVLSSSILFWTNRKVRNSVELINQNISLRNMSKSSGEKAGKFPVGQTRLQPIGIVIFATMMGMATIQIITECVSDFIKGIKGDPKLIEMTVSTIITFGVIICFKVLLYLYCMIAIKRIESLKSTARYSLEILSIEALRQDHRNDIISNSFSLAIAILASHFTRLWSLDPVGALLISIYILFGWIQRAMEQIRNLVGRSASIEFREMIRQMSMSHSPKIEAIENLLAYHIGSNIFVEVHIVVDGQMFVKEAHDIGESLEMKIESLPEVERAFVHIDYSLIHEPEHAMALQKFYSEG